MQFKNVCDSSHILGTSKIGEENAHVTRLLIYANMAKENKDQANSYW